MPKQSVNDCIMQYEQAKQIRQPHENDWRLASAYCLQQHYGQWMTDGPSFSQGNTTAAALRRTVFDSTGMRSLPKYMAILERLLTPAGSRYQILAASNMNLMKNYRVRQYFDLLNDTLFKWRNNPRANFRAASNEVYASMGAYGTGPIFVGRRIPNAISRAPSLIYKACPLKDIFILVNDQGEVYRVFRRYYLNLPGFLQAFPNVALPRTLALEASKTGGPNLSTYCEFFQDVCPQEDFDPEAWDERRMPFVSRNVCVTDKQYVDAVDKGYKSMPFLTPRTFTVSGDPYGFGPAVNAIASMGGASAVKKAYLQQGNLAAQPAILAADDGVINGTVTIKPGHVNYGAIDRQGRKLMGTLEPGRWDINAELLKEEQSDVEDSFFVTLFQILQDRPEMTATEVLEHVADRASLLSPTMGRGQTEFLGPMTERDIDVLDELGVLPPMPPELVEAAGQYEVQYTSPMAKGLYAEEVSGFSRAVEFALGITEATQDPSHLDHFNFDVAIPEMADKTAVPTRWMASPEMLEEKRQSRQQQQDTQQAIEAAPAAAQVMNAASKAKQVQAA